MMAFPFQLTLIDSNMFLCYLSEHTNLHYLNKCTYKFIYAHHKHRRQFNDIYQSVRSKKKICCYCLQA